MQDSSAFQFLAIDTIHESTTNPRRTFDETRLYELATSIRQHGLIQPITVRPNEDGFEIVAGARRYRAAKLAELFSNPARIVQIDDAQALEWQLVENSQRVDVHPFEEAQGFQRLLNIPGYDVAALVEKSGKSASHIYARLSLLQLIPEVAEAFLQERITASHANLIARIPQESQAIAFEQCWRKDWQDKEPHLLPAKHLSAWIQANLYLALADAPFDREDPTLNPAAGACVACPRRSGYNTSLFCDVQGDQCLDSSCYQIKVAVHIDREIAGRPGLVQIENGYRNPKEQRPGAIRQGQFREIETVVENPDAEPALPCASAKTAIIVYGKRAGKTVTICTDPDCLVHDPRAGARQSAKPAPVIAPATESDTQTGTPEPEHEQHETEREEERQRLADERKQQLEREQQEYEAERTRKEEIHQQRVAMFDRILANAPAVFTAAQLRVFLHALITIDPYTFADDVAEHFIGDDENNQQTAEEILLSTLHSLADDKLTGFGLRLVLTGRADIPSEGKFDLLAEAEAAFVPAKPDQVKKPKKAKPETKAKAPAKPRSTAQKKIA